MTHPLDRLWQDVDARRGADPDESWTARILSRGPDYAARKFGEEAVEAVVEGVRGDADALRAEAADVLYHLCVLLASRGVTLHEVCEVLDRRAGRSGLDEKAARDR